MQETDIEKYVLLNSTAETHDEASSSVIQRIRDGKYVYIDWRVNLLSIMRKSYAETERCDITMSMMERFIKINWFIPKKIL